MRSGIIITILVLSILLSCTSGEAEKFSTCRYTSSNLLAENDTSLLEIKQYKDDNLLEILDKGSDIGARGIYKFDNNKTLRFYAFLISDSNDYVWSRTYDTLGSIIENTGGSILLWYFNKPYADSIGVTAFLSTLGQKYQNIKFSLDRKKWQQPLVFKSPIFSNVIGCKFIINAQINYSHLFIRGDVIENCAKEMPNYFIDSIVIPKQDPATQLGFR